MQSTDMRRNKALFGVLATVNEFHSVAAEIFIDYSDSYPDEPRYKDTKNYFAAISSAKKRKLPWKNKTCNEQ